MVSQTTFININNVKNYFLEKEKQDYSQKKKERDDIVLKLKAAKSIWRKYGIYKVYLYGAFADMTFHKYSDIDIAIESEIDFEKLTQIYSEINKYFTREIDMRLLNELPFSDKVKKTGIVIL